MKIHNVQQKSPEWYALRSKYPLTASEAQAIGNNGKGLESLVWEKLSEKYSWADKEQYTNKDLERGNELEDQARELYKLQTGNKVETVGFVTNEEISKVGGASPDGLVVEDGLLEIKCFADTKHFMTVLEHKKTGTFQIESKYIWQMQMQMLFTGRNWCDFLAYNPNYSQSLLIQRVHEDKEMQQKIRDGLVKGEAIISEIEKYLQ